MASNDRNELMLSTVMVVLSPEIPPPPIGFEVQAVEAILKRPLSISQSPESLILTSNRDQAEIQLLPNKIEVRESSGEITQSKDKIPRIMHDFLAILGEASIQSYGVNFISEVNMEGPREWLGRSLLNQDLASKVGVSFSSDLVALRLDRPPKTWTIRFEAQRQNRISVNFNASESTDALPSREKLNYEIEDQYKSLNEFLSQIGLLM